VLDPLPWTPPQQNVRPEDLVRLLPSTPPQQNVRPEDLVSLLPSIPPPSFDDPLSRDARPALHPLLQKVEDAFTPFLQPSRVDRLPPWEIARRFTLDGFDERALAADPPSDADYDAFFSTSPAGRALLDATQRLRRGDARSVPSMLYAILSRRYLPYSFLNQALIHSVSDGLPDEADIDRDIVSEPPPPPVELAPLEPLGGADVTSKGVDVADVRQPTSQALSADSRNDPTDPRQPLATDGPAGAGPHPSPDTLHAAERGVVVRLPDGETVPDRSSWIGKITSPVDNLPEVAAAGRETGRTYKAMLANPDGAEGAFLYLVGALQANLGHGGRFDYQRSAPSQAMGTIAGFTQHPQFWHISNFNVGLFSQQAGLSREETLTIAGNYAHHLSSNARPDQPYGLHPETRQFIEAGYDAGERGLFGPAATP
jgi:hypothetical protein